MPPLRLTLSIWVAVGIGVSAWIETQLSKRMAREIDAVSLQQESKELLQAYSCLLYTSPSPRDVEESRMPSSA